MDGVGLDRNGGRGKYKCQDQGAGMDQNKKDAKDPDDLVVSMFLI